MKRNRRNGDKRPRKQQRRKKSDSGKRRYYQRPSGKKRRGPQLQGRHNPRQRHEPDLSYLEPLPQTIPERRRAPPPEMTLSQLRTAFGIEHQRSVPREESRFMVVDRRGHRPAITIEDDESESDEGEGDGANAPDAGNGAAGDEQHVTGPQGMTVAMDDLIQAMRRAGVLVQAAAGDEDEFFDLGKFRRLWERSETNVLHDSLTDEGIIERYMRRLFGRVDNMARLANEGYGEYLLIPGRNNFDLSLSIFLYLLHYLANQNLNTQINIFAHEQGPFSTRVSIGSIFLDRNELIPYTTVMDIFGRALSLFREQMPSRPRPNPSDFWDETGSGEVFVYVNAGADFKLKFSTFEGFSWAVGGVWTPAMQKVIDEVFPNGGIVCTSNETDSLCLLYAIAMGVVWISMRNFFSRAKTIDVNTLSRRIDGLVLDDVSNAKEIMRKIRQRSDGDLCSEIEDLITRNFSTKDICDIFQRIEDEVLYRRFALDIYKMEVSAAGGKRLFPCYISNRTSNQRISIVNVSRGNDNHYCLITNLREIFNKTGGKVFFTCATCHKAFYSKQMLQKHDCNNPRVKKWSWSTREGGVEDCEAGFCEKCHLLFEDEARLEFHKRHCFMRHRAGTRYVSLCKERVLKGGGSEETIDERHLIFADFESCIKADGEHEMMSYGYYVVDRDEYVMGFGIEKFMMEIENVASENKETHIFFHNAMNYDVNFMLQYILEHKPCWGISVIMKSSSRLQTVTFTFRKNETLHKLVVGDTFHFMTMSLSRIVDSIRKDNVETNMQNFPHFFDLFRRHYKVPNFEIDKILKKNLFPYRFFDSTEKLKTPFSEFRKIFEPREENLQYFSEGLTVKDLEENYPLYMEIVRVFSVYSAVRYHNLYLMCDVMQIADVFLRARQSLFETHAIDIAKYIGMPSASWAAFLKMNPDMELPLYDETRFAEFFSYMTRGGVTSAPLRYAQSDATHSIIYLDVNGLYPYVMQQYKYPLGEMEWEDINRETDCEDFLMKRYFPFLTEHGKGACLCVDMHIPDELKFRTDQYPFAPEHKVLKDCYFDEHGAMYPFLRRWSEANDGEQMKPFIGLVGTLYDKEKYGVHWQLLKWYIEHGMKITKIHFAVVFDEGEYLKSYVSLNIEIRNKRTDELGKMVYKLLGNSIYGKTFESPFNRGTYLIVREADKLRGLLEEGSISSITPLEGGNCIVKLDAEDVFLDKPTYIGACVTEYAKLHMYRLLYDEIGKVFPNLELVYTDTDSFIIRVEHPAGMDAETLFKYIDEKAPGLIGGKGGQVKSETGTDVIQEVVALRSKLYAYVTKKGKIGKRAKGTTAAAQETELSWDTYKEALFTLKAVPTHNMQFQRSGFHIKTVDLVKQSISVNDGKRYICEDGIHTHAWGF